ncbi:MAG TPA: hypothetical protein VEW95_10505 [Candidatus Limnocylindrales bacterium]|nr:hypothetical protein [Candidatus Limnocylindrales bacterium]
MNTKHKPVEQSLAAAFQEPLSAPQRARLDDRVTAALDRAPTRLRRRRFRVNRSLLLVAAMLIMAPALFAAGAAIFSTEAPYGMGNADAYDAELAAAKAVTPIPPGATWPPHLDQAEDRDASYGTGLGRSMVEINAYCLWLGYWYEAQDDGDSAAVDAAVAALNDAREWETFTDPLTSDEGFRDHTQATIDAAVEGDEDAVLSELELNCQGTWPTGG